MANIKQQVIDIIKKMPDESSVEEIIAKLYFIHKVETGLRELDNGKRISHKEVKERLIN